MSSDQVRISEEEATTIAWDAIEQIGGPRSIYRNPRQAFSAQSRRIVEVGEHKVEIRYGEISTPAIATIGGWVFEITDEAIELLIRPPKPRDSAS
jgi:ABC-type sugar transport system ATPase subunit